ncbi:MAG: AMP-binding enzyme [Acidimicrobiales bacterium]
MRRIVRVVVAHLVGIPALGPAIEAIVEEFRGRLFRIELPDVLAVFGSTEAGVGILRTPDTPAGSLGRAADDDTVVMDPATALECRRARFDDGGRLLNAEEAIGEFVNKVGLAAFEGCYDNDDANAERSRNGWYWSGDLGYRDEHGFFYFDGRGYDWLRVDGENFSAAPVERIVLRHPPVRFAAVYAVPDPNTGDQLMLAVELVDGATFEPEAFAAFVDAQLHGGRCRRARRPVRAGRPRRDGAPAGIARVMSRRRRPLIRPG